MRQHKDIVQGAALRVGLKQAGQDLEGPIYQDLLGAFQDELRAFDEEYGLDFDPLAESEVPEARAPSLIAWFMYQPIFDPFDTRKTAAERVLLERDAEIRLINNVKGGVDYIPDEVRDF